VDEIGAVEDHRRGNRNEEGGPQEAVAAEVAAEEGEEEDQPDASQEGEGTEAGFGEVAD